MERSVYANRCLSLHSQLKPDKLFYEYKGQMDALHSQPGNTTQLAALWPGTD